MVGFLRLIGKISRGEDIAVHKRDGRKTLGGKPVRHIGQVHKSATPVGISGGTISHTDNAVSSVAGATHTFSGRSIGTASANRDIIVGVACGKGATTTLAVSSMTIAGVSASVIIAGSHDVGGNTQIFELWQATVPSGTTGDIVVTVNESVSAMGIGIFAAYDKAFVAQETATNSSDPMNVSISVPDGGILLAFSTWNQATPPTAATWTNLTERFDQLIDASSYHTGACDAFDGAQTGLSITCDPNAALTDRWGMVAASFAPA